METIKLALYILSCTWFVTHLEPLQAFIQQQLLNIKMKLPKTNIAGAIFEVFFELATCWYCQTFWVTLIVTFNPFKAFLLSMIAWVIVSLTKRT
jgi:hypothetical protein